MPAEPPTYAVQLLKPFWAALRRYPQVSSADIDRLEREQGDKRMPVELAQDLLRSSVALIGDEDLGLKAARETSLGHYEVLEYATISASTWGDSLETFFRYSKLVNGAANFHLARRGMRAHVVFGSSIPLSRVAADFQLAAYFVATKRWVKEMPPGHEVWFSHAEPADLGEYRVIFGDTPLTFGAEHDALIVDVAQLDVSPATSDSSLHRVLRAHAEQLLQQLGGGDAVAERVRATILGHMREGRATAEHVAEKLGISRRSLTRKLGEEDTTFKQLLSEVRQRAAEHYLVQTDHSIEDIAFLLGYAESPPFIRAFTRWTGSSPLAYRRQRAQHS